MATFTVRRVSLLPLLSVASSSGKARQPVVLLAPRRTVSRGYMYYFSFLGAVEYKNGKRTIKLRRKPTQKAGNVIYRYNEQIVAYRFKPVRVIVSGEPKDRFKGKVIQRFKVKGVAVVIVPRTKPITLTKLYKRPLQRPDRGNTIWRQGGGVWQSLCYPVVSTTVESPVDATWNCNDGAIPLIISGCGNATAGILHNGLIQHNGEYLHGGGE